MTVLTIAVAVFGCYLSAYVLYQLVLFAATALIADPDDFEPTRFRRFSVIVPAHDEELYLPRLLASLAVQEYPQQSYRVTVVADNCSDGTAAVCRPFPVDVLERTDVARRGKGYAIRWAVERLPRDRFDAVAIVDGDSVVSPGFLKHLNLQMERGDRVIQCYNGVANPGQSWFTRLMNISRTIANEIVHPGKRKLGLSSYLMGNGMCFELALLTSHGWDAFSVGEDWEYYARLVLNGNHVGYSRHSRVYHQESITLRQASTQRLRWSSGRFQILRTFGPALVIQGLRTGSLRCLDASLPLVFPNPSLGINLTVVGLALAAAAWWLGASAALPAWFGVLILLQVGMFMIGVLYTDERLKNALSLVVAPVFLAWKMGIDLVSLFGIGTREWTRTERRLS